MFTKNQFNNETRCNKFKVLTNKDSINHLTEYRYFENYLKFHCHSLNP